MRPLFGCEREEVAPKIVADIRLGQLHESFAGLGIAQLKNLIDQRTQMDTVLTIHLPVYCLEN